MGQGRVGKGGPDGAWEQDGHGSRASEVNSFLSVFSASGLDLTLTLVSFYPSVSLAVARIQRMGF